MAAESELTDWNYFSYFTEIEDHFQRTRGTGLFLLSPLDWALIETWKNAGIPLEAILRGIDSAFEKWHAKKVKTKQVNSLAYCAQAVHAEAEAMARGGALRKQEPAKPPFTLDELTEYLSRNTAALRKKSHAFHEIAAGLEKLLASAAMHYSDLEELEQRLTALEEKMAAIVKSTQSDEELFEARRQLEVSLKPYRSKMTADQILMLEKQFLERNLLEKSGLPRLSLFYL